MEIFMTGNTGYIRAAVARNLIEAGSPRCGPYAFPKAERRLIAQGIHPGNLPVNEDAPLPPLKMVAWRVSLERRVLQVAEHGVRTIVIHPEIVYEEGKEFQPCCVPARMAQCRSWETDRITGPRWMWATLPGCTDWRSIKAAAGSLFLAASENVLVRDVAEAMREGQGSQSVKSLPVEQARSRLGAFADALILDQQVSSERAKRLLG